MVDSTVGLDLGCPSGAHCALLLWQLSYFDPGSLGAGTGMFWMHALCIGLAPKATLGLWLAGFINVATV
jgi:hypothetical protein